MGKRRYCRIVRGLLPCGTTEKKYIMERLESGIDSFLSDEPNADFNAIQQRFGTPEEVAASLIENNGTAEVLKAIRIRKKIVIAVIAALCAALVLFAAALIGEMIDYHDAFHGYGESTISKVETLPPDFVWDE